MDDDAKKQQSEADAELEREIRDGRKFSMAEAIGRMAGHGAMKGASPVSRTRQAAMEVEDWLEQNVSAASAELQSVLLSHVAGSERLLHDSAQPLTVLAAYCQRILDSDYLLKELVREADVEWGSVQQERPIFEREGSPPNPDDPYTWESVRKTLGSIIAKLAAKDATPAGTDATGTARVVGDQ
jgi:hypothetical protein